MTKLFRFSRDFQGKIERSGERLRTATARKTDKKRFRRRLRTTFFVPGLVFGRFWGPNWVPWPPPGLLKSGPDFNDFPFFSQKVSRPCPGSLQDQPRHPQGPPGDPLRVDFYGFLVVKKCSYFYVRIFTAFLIPKKRSYFCVRNFTVF